MSEYDAGTLPPICPQCHEWRASEWEECPDLATDTLGGDGEESLCETCGGEGGWWVCRNCGFSAKPSAPSPDKED